MAERIRKMMHVIIPGVPRRQYHLVFRANNFLLEFGLTFVILLKGNNSTSKGSSGAVKSEGGRRKRWLIIEMVCVVMTCMVLHVYISKPLI